MEKEKPPMREQITLRLSEELYAKLKQEANEKGIPIKDLILIIIDQHQKD